MLVRKNGITRDVQHPEEYLRKGYELAETEPKIPDKVSIPPKKRGRPKKVQSA